MAIIVIIRGLGGRMSGTLPSSSPSISSTSCHHGDRHTHIHTHDKASTQGTNNGQTVYTLVVMGATIIGQESPSGDSTVQFSSNPYPHLCTSMAIPIASSGTRTGPVHHSPLGEPESLSDEWGFLCTWLMSHLIPSSHQGCMHPLP